MESLSALHVAGIWARHLLAFWFPVNALVFLATGPHTWNIGLLFVIPIAVAAALDMRDWRERYQPNEKMPSLPFDAIVYALTAVQLTNIFLLARMFSLQGFRSLDFLLGIVIVGAGSAFAIITAHELIHRKTNWEQGLGRLLMCTVLYEHFYTEHLRGHHARVGYVDDPATARFGETFAQFYFRTVPAQFKNAWRLEKRRLGDEAMSNLDPRMLSHRCLHGLAVGWGLAFAILATCGLAAFTVFVLQAIFASRALEVVNYFEHWGIERKSARVRPIDSWDTHSWFTYYALIGLSRHADHHVSASRPYQQLRVHDGVPTLPRGYVAMVPLVIARNAKFRRLATRELEAKGLRPASDAASAPSETTPPG
jgi:alkane 1-monooxygenase